MDKQELLDTMIGERAKWEELVDQVPPARKEEPGVVGNWSIKDLITHITFWEQQISTAIDEALQGKVPQYGHLKNVDELNEENFQRNHRRSLVDMRADARRVFERLLDQVRALSEKDLFDPNRFEWLHGHPLAERIAGESYDHYQEHIRQIQAWLGSKPSASV